MHYRLEPEQPQPPKRGSEPGRAIRAAIERKLREDLPGDARQAPPAISDHELLQRIGGGAYGDVWLARNALGTLRAVKIVYRDFFEDDRPYQREFTGILKYEPVSRTHQGLMQILHVGRNDSAGFFYYVMELADGADAGNDDRSAGTGGQPDGKERQAPAFRPRTLRTDQAGGLRLAPLEAARVTLKLADALAHLHGHGLVHRDIKPANVIFVGGQPKLADIGLVAGLGDSRSFVGTEGYIPPEGPGTAQADLYSLGKLLYELATGRDRLEFPQLPRQVGELPEGEALLDLNEVITRACALEPKNRYATARQMQLELQSFIAGGSLRAARKVERHLVWLRGLAAAAVAMLLVGGAVVWIAKANERQAVRRARVETALRARAESAERAFQGELYTALLGQARATVNSHDLGQRVRSLDALRRAAAITNAPELRQAAMAALALPDLRLECELPYGGEYTVAELDPAFQRVALCKESGSVEIRSVADGRLLATLAASVDSPAFIVNWSPNGRFLGVKRNQSRSGDQSYLEIWDTKKLHRVLLVRDAGFGACSFDAHLPRVLTSCNGAAAAVWDLETGSRLATLPLEGDTDCLVISPEGGRFVAACRTNACWTVSVHRIEDGALVTSYVASDLVSSLDWHPDGRWIAVADHSGAVYLLDSRTGVQRALGRHKVQAVLARFSPDGQYLFSGGWERELILWDLNRMERALTLRLGSFTARFSADGRQCAFANASSVQIHSFELPRCDRELAEDLGGRMHFAAFSPDGQWLAASGLERMGVWDLAHRGPAALAGDGAGARLFFAENNQLFASRDVAALRWHPCRTVEIGKAPVLEPMPLANPHGMTSLCVFSNQVAWISSTGSRVSGPDSAPGEQGNWTATTEGIGGASPDGRWLAVYQTFTPRLYLYQLPGLQLACTITNQENIGAVAFSPSGGQLAITSPGRVEFWSTGDWRHLREVNHCTGVLFCPGENAVWLTRDYSEAGLYDLRSLALLLPLPTGWLPVALSHDGRRLAVSIDAQRLQVWDLDRLRKELRAVGLDWQDGAPSAAGRLASQR